MKSNKLQKEKPKLKKILEESKENNIKWHCSSFVDDFICSTCQGKHKYLHIQWTEVGNILELSSSTSEKGCEFLDKFREGVIYDLTGKSLEEVIEDEFTRKIISKRLASIKKEYKNNQRDKIICEKLGERRFIDDYWVKGDLEKAGIELIKEKIFACDKCEKRFADIDIAKKNYQIDYSETLYCGKKSSIKEKIYNIHHQTCKKK